MPVEKVAQTLISDSGTKFTETFSMSVFFHVRFSVSVWVIRLGVLVYILCDLRLLLCLPFISMRHFSTKIGENWIALQQKG